MLFIDETTHVYTAGRGHFRAEQLLEVLAGVRMKQGDTLSNLGAAVRQRCHEMASCILVLAAWDEARRELVDSLRRDGLNLLVFAVVPDAQNMDKSRGIHRLRLGHIQQDLLQS